MLKKDKFNLYCNSKEYKWLKGIFYFALLLVLLGLLAKGPQEYSFCAWIKCFYPDSDLILGFAFAIIVNYMFYIRTNLAESKNKDFLLGLIVQKAKFIFTRSLFASELISSHIKDDDDSPGISIESKLMAEELNDLKTLLIINFSNIYFETSCIFFRLTSNPRCNIQQKKLFFDEIGELEIKFTQIFNDDMTILKILHEFDLSKVKHLKDAWKIQYPDANFELITSNMEQKILFGKTTEELRASIQSDERRS